MMDHTILAQHRNVEESQVGYNFLIRFIFPAEEHDVSF